MTSVAPVAPCCLGRCASAVHAPKAWGWELWLNSTRPEAPAGLPGHAGAFGTLAALIAKHPEALGEWSRALFGDAVPIFTKVIHTSFPSRVHLGFRRPVDPAESSFPRARANAAPRALRGAPACRAPSRSTSTTRPGPPKQALAAWRPRRRRGHGERPRSLRRPRARSPFVAPGRPRQSRRHRRYAERDRSDARDRPPFPVERRHRPRDLRALAPDPPARSRTQRAREGVRRARRESRRRRDRCRARTHRRRRRAGCSSRARARTRQERGVASGRHRGRRGARRAAADVGHHV